MLLDVATGGELHVALAAGVPAEQLVLHGNNKSVDELRTASPAASARIVVDSFDELDRLDALHAGGRPRAAVLLRITPGVEAHTHEFVATGQDDSKFGFGLGSGDAPTRSIDRAARDRQRRPRRACTATSAARCSRVEFFAKAVEVHAAVRARRSACPS